MKKAVQEYLKALNTLFSHFGCQDEYLVKPLVDYNWKVQNNPDISLITYWNDGSGSKTAVIVKKNGMPMIYKSNEFTLIIAIDCVKTAFLLRNSNLL